MKMILTAGALSAALLLLAVSAVNAKALEPLGQSVATTTLVGE